MTPQLFEELRPLSRDRAREILAQGREASEAGIYLRQLLTDDELFLVQKFWQQDAPGSWSFNDVIRECAR